jgi:hypothetical protein
MDDDDLKAIGPSFLGDLAREGGTPIASGMTNDELKAIGPDFVADLAREGGTVIAAAP